MKKINALKKTIKRDSTSRAVTVIYASGRFCVHTEHLSPFCWHSWPNLNFCDLSFILFTRLVFTIVCQLLLNLLLNVQHVFAPLICFKKWPHKFPHFSVGTFSLVILIQLLVTKIMLTNTIEMLQNIIIFRRSRALLSTIIVVKACKACIRISGSIWWILMVVLPTWP